MDIGLYLSFLPAQFAELTIGLFFPLVSSYSASCTKLRNCLFLPLSLLEPSNQYQTAALATSVEEERFKQNLLTPKHLFSGSVIPLTFLFIQYSSR